MLWVVAGIGVLLFALFLATRRAAVPAATSSPFRMPAPDPNVFMIRGFDFYARLDPERRVPMLESVRSAVAGRGTVYDQGSHAVVLWHDFHPPEQLLEGLSRDLPTQVIWLSFQKQVDAFEYVRWEGGTRLRHLVFGCYEKERTWERVEGEPEPWEAAAIFDVARLERRLASSEALSPESRTTPEEAARLRALWRERRLLVDSSEPGIEARDVAEAVAIAHGLPGWR